MFPALPPPPPRFTRAYEGRKKGGGLWHSSPPSHYSPRFRYPRGSETSSSIHHRFIMTKTSWYTVVSRSSRAEITNLLRGLFKSREKSLPLPCSPPQARGDTRVWGVRVEGGGGLHRRSRFVKIRVIVIHFIKEYKRKYWRGNISCEFVIFIYKLSISSFFFFGRQK